MPGSTILKFTDPDLYMDSIHGGAGNLLITSGGSFEAELTQVQLHQLYLQRGRESLPRIERFAHTRAGVEFVANQAAGLVGGRAVLPGQILHWASGAEIYRTSSTETYWATIELPLEDLAAASQAIAGRPASVPSVYNVIRPAPQSMVRLVRLYQAAANFAATAPEILTYPEVARAIEQELLRALIACLADSTLIKTPIPNRQRIIQRFHQVLEANKDETLYMAEVCAAVGVSERTLQIVCRDYLELTPHRYLWLRRMHLARRALSLADPKVKSVTEIAYDYGFAELGRFAVTYRAMYGESPSATLRRVTD